MTNKQLILTALAIIFMGMLGVISWSIISQHPYAVDDAPLVYAHPPTPEVIDQLAMSNGFQQMISLTDVGPESSNISVQKGETVRWVNNSGHDMLIVSGSDNNKVTGGSKNTTISTCDETQASSCKTLKQGEFLERTFDDGGARETMWVYIPDPNNGEFVQSQRVDFDLQNSTNQNNVVGIIPIQTDNLFADHPTCYVTVSPNPIVEGETSVISYTSSNAEWFYINNVGHMIPNAGGSFSVYPSVTTDYFGRVTDAAGNQYPCLSGPAILAVTPLDATAAGQCISCPAGFEIRNGACVCPIGQFQNNNGQCVLDTVCPAGYVGTPPTCTATSGACPSGYVGTPPNCSVAASCPLNYSGTPPNCILDSCVSSNICSGNNVVDSCTGAVIKSCEYQCQNGACIVPSPLIVSWLVSPTLVRSGNPTNVSWNVKHVASCTVTSTAGDSWTGRTGTEVSNPLTTQTIFTLRCKPLSGSRAKDISQATTVNIVPSFQEQ